MIYEQYLFCVIENLRALLKYMFTTVTLNPCIDKSVTIPEFIYGGTNKIQQVSYEYAGKGINVAKAISNLGFKVISTGFLYQSEAENVIKTLSRENLIFDSIICPGKLRTNTKIFDISKSITTELNESGVPTNTESLKDLLLKIEELSKTSNIIIFSGSVPPNCPDTFYQEAIKLCNPFCKTILDTSGEKLIQGIKAKPTIIKPNLSELETAFNIKLDSIDKVKKTAINIINEYGIEIVCVSMGSQGALITNGKETFFSPPVENIVVKGTVCAGDCLVAGIATGYALNLPIHDIFARGIASATACVVQGNSQVVTKSLLEEILPKVKIQAV